jgi:hypothetical protein
MCDRIDLHPAHQVPKGLVKEKIKQLKKAERKQSSSMSQRPPWRRPAPKVLDNSIARAVSKTYPKPLDAILREVEDDYGLDSTKSAFNRNVQRHLTKLVERGHILRIDLGQRLYAYLRPGSALVDDIGLIREQIEIQIAGTLA